MKNGGSIHGEIDALDRILDRTVYSMWEKAAP